MRALLINPLFPRTYWGFEHTQRFTGKPANLPPVGLLTAAALLPKHWDVRFVDLNIQELSDAELDAADVVLLGGMRIQRESFHEVVRRAHQRGKKVVAGGAYVTTDPEAASDVDHLVLGEVEETLPDFARAFEEGAAPKVVRAPKFPSVTQAPIPRYDLVDASKYNCFGVQFSRGCPFNCEFCDIIEMFGRVPRVKEPEQLLRELEAIRATGFSGSVFVVDDNFIGNKAKAKKFLARLIEWNEAQGRPFDFFTEASVNLAADDELLRLMVDANFTAVFLGIETPSREALLAAQKMQNVSFDLTESVEKLARAGLEVMAGFIVGFDSDGADVFDRQIDFINGSPISMAMVGMLIALPGTQLWRRLKAEGRLRQGGNGDNTEVTNFEPVMPEETLLAGYHRLLKTLYTPRAYFDRAFKGIALKAGAPRRPTKRSAVFAARALANSLVRQGLFSSYKREYWRFLYRVLRTAPSQFADAIAQAIRGDHFIRFTTEDVSPKLESHLVHLQQTASARDAAPEPRSASPRTRAIAAAR